MSRPAFRPFEDAAEIDDVLTNLSDFFRVKRKRAKVLDAAFGTIAQSVEDDAAPL